MMRHPIIGLNMSMDLIDKYEKFGMLVPVSYVDAVTGAGGVPVCIPPYKDISMFRQVLPLLDGVLFIGGDDYLPEHYGGHPQPANELMPERRDRFDLALAKWILEETSLPVLGICGGHQLIAIALGGALIQDIQKEWQAPHGVQPLKHSRQERTARHKNDFRHSVRREPDSLVVRVTQVSPGEALQTNSFHHQAVHPEKVGRCLRATAWSDDGVIEAIEPSLDSPWAHTGRFVLGVQWHPERMQDETPHRNIFFALVEAAKRK
jgi:gamma-glutamyl-gamma-aminobutyrate hydrolase PuuD